MDVLCDRPRRRLTDIRWETSSDPGRGSITRISNNDGPQIPVVSDDIPCPTSRDVVVSRVGAVRPLKAVAPRSGAVHDHCLVSYILVTFRQGLICL